MPWAQDVGEFGTDHVGQGRRRKPRQFRLPTAPHHGADQHVAFRRRVRPEARGEQGSQDAAVLGARHQEPEAVQRVRHAVAPESESHHGHRVVGDGCQILADFHRQAFDAGKLVGGNGEHHVVELPGSLAASEDPEAARPFHGANRFPPSQRPGDPGRQSLDKVRHSPQEAVGSGSRTPVGGDPGPRLARGEHPAEQRAVQSLHVLDAGKRRPYG